MEASARPLSTQRLERVPWGLLSGPVSGVIAQLVLLAVLAGSVGLSPGGWAVGAGSGAMVAVGLAYGLVRYGAVGLGVADKVTLTRASLAVAVAALVASSLTLRTPVALLASLTALALALDFVDGWVARRTRTTALLGAQFDGEVDAFLILVLSVYVARSVGAWVLAIGLARYVFLAAGWPLEWMNATLPRRDWRKVVCALQGIVLAVAVSHVLPAAPIKVALGGCLILLAESFGRDVCWLWTHRQGKRAPVAATADTSSGIALDHPTTGRLPRRDPVDGPARTEQGSGRGSGGGPGGGPARPRIAVALTILAGLVVWLAMVVPDQPRYFTPGAFLRVPLELLVLVALAAVLPKTPRRVLAAIAALLLALVVVLKAADYEMFSLFARPFDPLGDTGQLGNGIETLRSIVGHTDTVLIEIGVVVGIVVVVVVLILAMLRLTRVAAENRGWALRSVAAVGGVWLLCWVLGAQLIFRTPIASTLAAGVIVDELSAVQADLHDQQVFAAEIRDDPYRNVPTSRLLTALRGKDVLLVFVEAYGQVAVQGSSFSPEVDAALAAGNARLQSAGFSARSGFLTSSTFGGISWLAHSSVQSGLWVDSSLRYSQLLPAHRFTLAEAFKRAGWRTVDDIPSNDRPWPQGAAFYHWDQIYNRKQVGYHGPTFSYASMPDQYIYLELQRLELGKAHRRPLFAEVDTVSSHVPWSRIPELIPWNRVGNGSVFKHTPMFHATAGFRQSSTRMQAAYGHSIVYAMTTLTQFVQRYGKKNLVLIVLGDHQPISMVSGQTANHDVPISIISHDPKVLQRIGSWGWNPGLQPNPNAPVWRMSAFRNRFLNAFDTPATAR